MNPNEYDSVKKALKELGKRKFTGYPNRKYYQIFVAHCYDLQSTKSKMVTKIMCDYLDRIPLESQKKYLDLFKELSSIQKKYTGRSEQDCD
jgi:hypothetical protein